MSLLELEGAVDDGDGSGRSELASRNVVLLKRFKSADVVLRVEWFFSGKVGPESHHYQWLNHAVPVVFLVAAINIVGLGDIWFIEGGFFFELTK